MKNFILCLFSVATLGMLLSTSSKAADIVCNGTWDVFECADGTQMGCASEGVQMDCTQDGWGDMAADFCSSHGGINEIVEGKPTCEVLNSEIRLNPDFAINGPVLNTCSIGTRR